MILLDLGLPDSDGLATVHRMVEAAGDVPIVVLSGLADPGLATAAVQAGAQDYLVKTELEGRVLTRVIHYAVERRAAQVRLRERDAHYRSIVESSLDAIISMDEAGRIIEFNPAAESIHVRDLDHRISYFNKSAERMHGWAAADIAGQSVRERFFPDPAIFDAAMSELFERGGWQGELTVAGHGGSRLTVESRWTLMLDTANRPRAVLVIDTDITERKDLERRFFRAQRMESIGTLASGIAHDLNNVLAPVLMSIELLKDDTAADERLQIIDMIEASTRRGAQMVRQVLSFVRGVEGERTAVDIPRLVSDVEKIVTDTFVKSIIVRTDISGAIPTVLGDATQLHQVLVNLCVNARDAMPGGGTLSLSASAQQLDERGIGLDASVRPGARSHVRTVLHQQAVWPRHRPRPFDLARHRQEPRRVHAGRE